MKLDSDDHAMASWSRSYLKVRRLSLYFRASSTSEMCTCTAFVLHLLVYIIKALDRAVPFSLLHINQT